MHIHLFETITNNDKLLLVNNMAVALKAGLTTTEAIQINIDQSESYKMRQVLTDIKKNVEDGKSLSDSFALFPKYFSEVFINIVSAGEQSGRLEKNLGQLGIQLHRNYDLQKKVQSALIYPFIILIATLFIGIGLSIYVLPKLLKLFKSFGEELPLLTRIILDLSDILRIYWPGFIVGAVTLYLLYRYLLRFEKVRKFIDKIVLNFPISGRMFQYMNVARIVRSFGSLLGGGLSINECLVIIKSSQSSPIYKEITESMYISVTSGSTLYDAIYNNKYVPILVSKMVGMGEKTGNLEKTFSYLAEYYEKELYRLADNLATTIEPILLIIVGIGVGIVAISIITPIYKLTGSLNRLR